LAGFGGIWQAQCARISSEQEAHYHLMPARIPISIRQDILHYSQQNLSITDIYKILLTAGHNYSYSSVRKCLKTIKNRDGDVTETKRKGPEPSYGKELNDKFTKFFDDTLYDNNELTAPFLCSMIKREFGVNLTISMVKRIRLKLGWRYANTKYGTMVRDVNKIKRVDFCQRMIDTVETFK